MDLTITKRVNISGVTSHICWPTPFCVSAGIVNKKMDGDLIVLISLRAMLTAEFMIMNTNAGRMSPEVC